MKMDRGNTVNGGNVRRDVRGKNMTGISLISRSRI